MNKIKYDENNPTSKFTKQQAIYIKNAYNKYQKLSPQLKKYGKFCDALIEAKNTMIIEQHQEIKSLKQAIKEYEEDIPKLGNTILSLAKDKKRESDNNSDNIIPEMTHPLGKGWSGPDRNEIQIDHQYARMSKSTFNRVQHVRGSGALRMVYEGKMWKTSDDEIHWQLHWWSASDDPDKCKHNLRDIIVLVDEKNKTI